MIEEQIAKRAKSGRRILGQVSAAAGAVANAVAAVAQQPLLPPRSSTWAPSPWSAPPSAA
jgi:hypothetical protein